MQADRVQVLAQQAAAGNVEAFIALVQEFAPDLRLALAAHLDQPTALAAVESAVWSAVRSQLGEFIGDPPFASWIQSVAIEPVTAHLTQADRRAVDIQDALAHQNIQACHEAIADGRELQVAQLRQRIAALPEATRALLTRRYRDRQRPSDIAANLMISESELAISLATARAFCDWRELARPPAAGERLLPPLIEDWLNHTIDVDSRALLATNLGRDPERAAQFARQVRVHLALGACLAPFTREDAVALVRQTGLGAGDSGRVMMGEVPRSASPVRLPGSSARRPVRMTISNRHVVPLTDDAPRSSPLPWIIGGGMVLVGALALLVMTLGAGTTRIAAPRPSELAPAPTVVVPTSGSGSQQFVPPRFVGGDGSVLRPMPGAPSEPRVILVGAIAGTHVYIGKPFELRALVSGIPTLTEVEYWAGDQRLGTAREIPFSLKWTPSRVGAVTVQVRAMIGAVMKTQSEPMVLTVVQAFGSGQFTREWWGGLPGEQIADGMSALTATTPPSGRVLESQFAAPRDFEDSYLQRLSGYVIPPLDGEYVFWICSDDEGELWLSSDDTYEHRTRIALAPSAVRYQAWDHDTRQRSAPIRLRAGQRYYCEALHKEGMVHDHLDVGWQLPDGSLERPISGIHLTPAPPAPTPTQTWTGRPVPELPAGALLQGAVAPSALVVNLSDLGASDWIHYGLKDAASFTRRIGGGQLAVARTADQAPIERYDNNKVRFGWSNGTPDAAIAETRTGWCTDNGGKGFTFTAPADPVLRRLVVWVGGWKTHAILTATLSDNSALLYHDDSITIDAIDGGDSFCYTLLYRAKEQGAKLTISYSSDNPNDGNITLQAVALGEYGDGSPRFVKASPGSPPPAAVPAPAISAARRPDVMIWDGEGANGGAGYKGFGIGGQSPLEVAQGQGRAGTGLRARLGGGNAANVGWNWHSWSSDSAGTDLNGFAALTMWLRFSGPAAPQKVVMRLACSPRDPVRHTVDVNLTARQPGLLDGAWHQVIVPLAELVPQGQDFDRAKVWEVAFDISSTANMDGTFDVDEIGAVRSLTAPPPAAVVPWKVVRAINLGGEATEIDGVKFAGHRQAEADSATPVGSHQPGPRLSDLPWVRAANTNGDVRRNRSWGNKPLNIAGQEFSHGLGMHAAAEVVFALDGRYSGFTAVVGIDQAAEPGEAIFQVWVDGQKLFDSGPMRHGEAKPVAVPLHGSKELRLVADPSGGNDWDHADWGNAQLLVIGGNDGVLQILAGRRITATFAPKPAADAKLRSVLGSALVGTKDGLAFRVKVPNGPSRVWVWLAENGAANSRQFDLTVEGSTLPDVGLLPANGWEKVGPIEVVVADGTIDVAATVLKGTPQLMGILVEQPTGAPAPVTPKP